MAHTQDHAPPGATHYALGDRRLCGNESSTAVYSDDPRQGVGWPAAETAWSWSPRT